MEVVVERQVMAAAEAGSGQTWNGNEGKDSQVAGYWDQKRKVPLAAALIVLPIRGSCAGRFSRAIAAAATDVGRPTTENALDPRRRKSLAAKRSSAAAAASSPRTWRSGRPP